MPDSVEELGVGMIMECQRPRRQCWAAGPSLCCQGWRRSRDQLGELSEVLDGGCEVELVTRTAGAT